MQFVNILPTAFVNDKYFWCSDRHLAVAHLIEDGNKYTEEWKKLEGLKILDNGYFERLEAAKVPELVEKAKLIGAHYIVLPDTFYYGDKQFTKELKDMLSVVPKDLKIMVIPLAKNIGKFVEAFSILNEMHRVNTIAIPDHMLEQYTNIPRTELLKLIESSFVIKKNIHLLALDNWENLSELNKPYITSIDSTMPFKLGLFGKLMGTTPDNVKRPKDYFNISEITEEQKLAIYWNVRWIKEVLND